MGKGNIALGEIGGDWTKYHPEWKSTKVRRKDPYYDHRMTLWKDKFVESPEKIEEFTKKLMELKAMKEAQHQNTYNLEVPYVINVHKK